MASALFCI